MLILCDTPSVPVPDGIFWYALSTLLAVALFWIIAKYVNKLDTVIENLSDNDIRQDLILKHHGDDIEDLKNWKEGNVVKYPRKKNGNGI